MNIETKQVIEQSFPAMLYTQEKMADEGWYLSQEYLPCMAGFNYLANFERKLGEDGKPIMTPAQERMAKARAARGKASQ